jgi:NADH:ubiquinone oxidoreductase subunit 4 (subunit M)
MLTVIYFNYIILSALILSLLSIVLNLTIKNYLTTILLHKLQITIIMSISLLFTSTIFSLYNNIITCYTHQQLNYSFTFSNANFYFPFVYIFLLITLVSLTFCLTYNYGELNTFVIYITTVIISGFGLFYTDSIIYFFIFYEFLLLPSFFILYIFSKTRRSVEASYLMFFWTQFGALFLIFIFIYVFSVTNTTSFQNIKYYNFSKFEINFIFISLLIGFGVKLPIWPFYEWLPKAHVEASTNFSIFLSGVLVKFAFFGFIKCLLVFGQEPSFIFVYPYLVIGLTDSVFKMYYQLDIKKLIAYSTVAEMHWLLICILSGQSILWISGFTMLISHAILSTNSFLMVDSIARRFKTRLTTELHGLNFMCPKLFLFTLINCIAFLGFPGSLFFISEFIFFSFLLDLLPLLFFIVLVLIYLLLACFFFKIWLNILFSSVNNSITVLVVDLEKSEIVIFSYLIGLLFWLGLTWQSFLF